MQQCLPDEVWERLWSQQVTGTACIGLKQNIIDALVNEWQKHLLACVRIVGQHLKQIYSRQLKMDNCMKCQPWSQKCEQNVFLYIC